MGCFAREQLFTLKNHICEICMWSDSTQDSDYEELKSSFSDFKFFSIPGSRMKATFQLLRAFLTFIKTQSSSCRVSRLYQQILTLKVFKVLFLKVRCEDLYKRIHTTHSILRGNSKSAAHSLALLLLLNGQQADCTKITCEQACCRQGPRGLQRKQQLNLILCAVQLC